MATATSGTGSLTLGSALGAVAPNVCSFLSFSGAGVTSGQTVSYLLLDANGAWEVGTGAFSGTTLTRSVTNSSNSNSLISLSGNAQVYVTVRAQDLTSSAVLSTYYYTASAGQTVFSGPDNNSNALTYFSLNTIIVAVGGAVLPSNDYSAPDGATVTFNQPLDAGETVTINSFTTTQTLPLATYKTPTVSILTFTTGSGGFGTPSSGAATYTLPTGATWIEVETVGPGGGGGSATGSASFIVQGAGGASGGRSLKLIASPSGSYSCQIGNGGAAGTGGAAGSAGAAATSFGTACIANAGGGGPAVLGGTQVPGSATPASTSGAAGDILFPGNTGSLGFYASSAVAYGGGHGGSILGGSNAVGNVGTSPVGAAALGFGAGGNGGYLNQTTAQNGGAGSAGVIIVTEHYDGAGGVSVASVFGRQGNVVGQASDFGQNYSPLPQSYLAGLQLSNDVGTPNTIIDVTPGQCRDSANAFNIVLPAFTKTISSSWVAGTGNAGMGTGLTATASTWYHVFAAIINGGVDIFFDTSATAAHAPTGTTSFRRLGAIKTDGSTHILAFSQFGNEFIWSAPINEITSTAIPTSPTIITLLGVPPGVKIMGRFRSEANNNTVVCGVIFQSPDEASAVANAIAANDDLIIPVIDAFIGSVFDRRTNTSAQLRWSSSASGSLGWLTTYAWYDYREIYD